ncbi:hypothetical protein [Streptomyces sp. ICBB 8177]|uniref:hypothetical protein n=1 Tax=Streptomyces sp. ICBB 8177 TaxID=563922 RepID=UPI001F53E917|nr:hypothetical protein [Streptomyces sp. ICBB 8177]
MSDDLTSGAAGAANADEADGHAAAWSAEDDWTDESLRLLRDLRAPHRRKRAGQVAYVLYCVLLLLVVWGALPSLGLFLQASMGADYTGYGSGLLAALPSGACALGVGCLLLGARDALWRGPVVPPRESVDWLLAQPVRVGRVLRPWLWITSSVSAAAGVLAAAIGMVALGLTCRVGLPAAFGWCLVGAAGLPLLAVALGMGVEHSPRVAAWTRRLTPYATGLFLALVAQCGLAVAGHRVGWLERAELWSGPWGWAGLAALSPTRAAVPGGPVAAGLLLVVVAAAVTAAHRAAGTLPLATVRQRSRTATGVMTALLTVELRTARQVASGAAGGGRPARFRLPAPRRAWLAVPWRDALALLRTPGRLGRAVVHAALATLAAVVAAGAHGGTAVGATVVALAFAYGAVAQVLEPARLETDDTRRGSWSPYPYRSLMLRHAILPGALALLGACGVCGVTLWLGAGARAFLAPAAVPPLIAAGLVNACRGANRQHLLLSPAQSPTGSMGPLLFLLWYAAGSLTALVAMALPFTLALRHGTAGSVVTAAVMAAVLAAALLRWTTDRARSLTA